MVLCLIEMCGNESLRILTSFFKVVKFANFVTFKTIDHEFSVYGTRYRNLNPENRELIPVLGSQPAGDVSHKPGGRPAVTPANLKRAATSFAAW